MKKEYKISGMSCNHCRAHVEEALNTLPGVSSTVTLNPPVAIVEMERDLPLATLQEAVTEEAGPYTLSE